MNKNFQNIDNNNGMHYNNNKQLNNEQQNSFSNKSINNNNKINRNLANNQNLNNNQRYNNNQHNNRDYNQNNENNISSNCNFCNRTNNYPENSFNNPEKTKAPDRDTCQEREHYENYRPNTSCTYCSQLGHTEENCNAKESTNNQFQLKVSSMQLNQHSNNRNFNYISLLHYLK
jgi:hypothetical protein